MELRRYLFENNLSQVAFARMIDYEVQYLRAVMAGRKIAGAKMCRVIERVTNGEVKQEDLKKGRNRSSLKSSTNKNVAR